MRKRVNILIIISNTRIKRANRVDRNFIVIIKFGTYDRAIFFDCKTQSFTGKNKPDSIRAGSPQYVRMAELVHELDFLEHVWPVRRQLIHLEHHHLTRRFMSNLEKRSEHGGLVTYCDAQSRYAVIDVRSYDRCIRNHSDSLQQELCRGRKRKSGVL